MSDEAIFSALGDSSRRKLLDALFEKDGQSLVELQAQLPDMTRFGCMKHMRVLEDAGLVTTRKAGRRTLHYLNPVPLQQVYERWVRKYSRPAAESLINLKHVLENLNMDLHTHVYSIFIKTTPAILWKALTDGAYTRQYYFGTRFQGNLKAGEPYAYKRDDDSDMIRGEIVEVDPLKKLVTSFRPLFLRGGEEIPAMRVTFEIEAEADQCKLTLIHEDLKTLAAGQDIIGGWSRILSALKSLLESGAVGEK